MSYEILFLYFQMSVINFTWIYVGLWKSDFENEIFLMSRNFFAWILISKMSVKMNVKITRKNHEADPEIRFLRKSILKSNARATAMPPTWGLRTCFCKIYNFFDYKNYSLAQETALNHNLFYYSCDIHNIISIWACGNAYLLKFTWIYSVWIILEDHIK